METYVPTRWLLCTSPPTLDSLLGHWTGELGIDSLLSLRLRLGWIEQLTVPLLRDRVRFLETTGTGSVALVFDRVDDEVAEVLESLQSDRSRIPDIRILEWLASPIAVVSAMNSPDQCLLDALDAFQDGQPRPHGALPALPEEPWWPELERAMVRWETIAREDWSQEFADAYPDYWLAKIPWRRLAGLQDVSATAMSPVLEAANESQWTEYPLLALAAASAEGDNLFRPLRREAPGASAGQWSLTRAPVLGQPAVYLVFEVSPDWIGTYVGLSVEVVAAGRTFELGKVNADGIAELRVQGGVDMSDTVIRIGPAR